MSSELPPRLKEDADQASARKDGAAEEEDNKDDSTPKSEMPIAVKASTPSSLRQHGMANDYFSAYPAATEQLAQTYNVSPTPSISASDVTATGQIQPLPLTDVSSAPDRPQPHTAASTTSVQTASSAATVVAPSSAPMPARPRPPYPNQSYAALHHQQYPVPYPPPLLKQRTAHPGQIATFASALASLHSQSGSRTVGNSPSVTPGTGLFNPHPVQSPSEWDLPTSPGTYASPFLHFTQRVPPKETHVADVDVDPVSGRKLINHYEIIDELGRGTHGKVKLGRDLDTDGYVAIKIVERFSRRRKLGKLGTTEDKVKKEVAILKQARHPHVVALLEVIDDPSRKKVYIVLEWVERGEIQWRTKGPKEIAMVEARRYERERAARAGKVNQQREVEDAAVLEEAQKRLLRLRRRQHRALRRMRRDAANDPEAWSIELAGDELSDMSDDDRLSRVSTESYSQRLAVDMARRASRTPSPLPPTAEVAEGADVSTPTARSPSQWPSVTNEPLALSPTTSRKDFGEQAFTGLEGTMYGAYVPTSGEPSRTSSLVNSLHSSASASARHGSSDTLSHLASDILESGLDSELEYVPLMTLQQARVAFRDTLLGLQYLHFQGIVHRDIKPPNLLATKDHRVKISDFGVSYLGKPINEGESGEGISEHDTQDLADEAKELAKTVGTPAFYAPELCISGSDDAPLPITKAIDVWALGVTLFCMLYARTPYVDNEFVVMRQIADEEVYIPRQRLKPVDSKSRSRPSSQGRAFPPLATGKRHELELSYEDIGDDLYDLLNRLLTKDPRKRITLEEVRHHPWVVADLPDKIAWLEETDCNRQSQGKKIEVSKEDVNAAVVPLQFLDRVKSGIKKVGERLGFGGPSRGRASSNAGAANNGSNVSPTPSTASSTNNSRDGRRHSLRGGEDPATPIVNALRSAREGEHPLSRSVAASPEATSQDAYFDVTGARPESALGSIEDVEPTAMPRPVPPERATTVMATGSLMRTLRQSDFRRSRDGESPPPSPGLPGTPTAIETAAGVLAGGWGSGVARRILKTVRERSTARSTSSDRSSIGSVDKHGEPSVAISQATAAGQLNTGLDELLPPSIPSSAQNSPTASRPMPMLSSPSREHLSPHGGIERPSFSRTTSTASITSLGRRAAIAQASTTAKGGKQVPPSSTDAEWQRATDEHIRKLVRENEESEEDPQQSIFDERTCPPSPDDNQLKPSDSRRISEVDISSPDLRLDTTPTSQDSQLPTLGLSSTSDLGSTSAVSVSISNPSIPSVISRASSVDPSDNIIPQVVEQKPSSDLMSSDDTLNPKTPFREELEVDEGYTADDNVFNSDGDEEEGFDSSSDSDGGLVMSRRKSATKALKDEMAASAAAAAGKERRLSTRSAKKKTSRSGSSKTVIRAEDGGEGEGGQEEG